MKNCSQPSRAVAAATTSRATVSQAPQNHAAVAVPGAVRCRYQPASALSTSSTAASSRPHCMTCCTSVMWETSDGVNASPPSGLTRPPRYSGGARFMM